MKEKHIVYDFAQYDLIIHCLFVNIYTLTKETEEVVVEDFPINSKKFLCFLKVCNSFADNFNKKLYVKMSFPKYVLFKILYGRHFNLKRTKSKQPNIDGKEVMSFMMKEMELDKDIFDLIYNTYYKKGVTIKC